MDVLFQTSFLKKLSSVVNKRTTGLSKFYRRLVFFYWSAHDTLRYEIPNFFKNLWLFRSALWKSHSYDSISGLIFLKKSLELTADYLEKYGLEIDETRLKKIEKIKRAVELLEYHISDDFEELAEKQLNSKVIFNFKVVPAYENSGFSQLVDTETEEQKENNRKIFKLSTEIENQTWKELFTILQGQDHDEYLELMKTLSDKQKENTEAWKNWFDGSGLKGWWD